MNKKRLVIIGLGVILIAISGFLIIKNPSRNNSVPSTSSTQPTITSVEYQNSQYGFVFSLPVNWKDYSIIVDKWNGQILDAQDSTETATTLEGPKILIRHPQWTTENPRQDIPIMIFTLSEWNLVQQEKLSVSAAPIGPSELGRNANYVFALPARYNFAFLPGYEEVETILQGNPLIPIK